MVYDSLAQRVAVKAIGTVESNLNYHAVNYNDPITVGAMQWYGTRAAGILNRIRTENPGSWVGVQASVTTSLDTYPATNSQYWTNRYLTRAEGESLKAVLEANKHIQNLQAFDDLDDYVDTATRQGIDKDNNTQMMLFFFVIYHQSPRRALQLIAANGPDSTIERLHAATLNESVLGQYRNRYNTAYTIIKNMDATGVDDIPGTVPPPTEGGDTGGGGGESRLGGPVRYVQVVGDNLFIKFNDGTSVFAYPNTANMFVPARDNSVGADPVPPPDNPDPEVPPGAPGNVKAVAIRQWLLDRLEVFRYSQGATRLDPYRNMYTDCSGLLYYAFQEVAGINPGTWTGDMRGRGTGIYAGPGSGLTEGILQVGDLIINGTNSSTTRHVEFYAGNGQTIGHGGPMDGPIVKPLSIRFGQPYIWVRRHFS